MKKHYAAALIGILTVATACEQFLDVNTNPNGPTTVSANLYLPPMLHWMVTSPQLDGRFQRAFPGEEPYAFLRYRVLRVWELPVQQLLTGGLGTLPLAPITSTS